MFNKKLKEKLKQKDIEIEQLKESYGKSKCCELHEEISELNRQISFLENSITSKNITITGLHEEIMDIKANKKDLENKLNSYREAIIKKDKEIEKEKNTYNELMDKYIGLVNSQIC